MCRSTQKKMFLNINNILLALWDYINLNKSKLSLRGRGSTRKVKTEYTDTAAFRANMSFLLAAAPRGLCLADDLTLHVTCGDITHSCEMKIKYGLIAHCCPSKSHRGRLQDLTDLVRRSCINLFHNNHSLKCTPILCRACKQLAVQRSWGNTICDSSVKPFTHKCSNLFMYAFIFPHLLEILSPKYDIS